MHDWCSSRLQKSDILFIFFDLLFINCKSNIYQLQDFLKNKLRRSIKGKETDWQTEMIKTSSITQII